MPACVRFALPWCLRALVVTESRINADPGVDDVHTGRLGGGMEATLPLAARVVWITPFDRVRAGSFDRVRAGSQIRGASG